MKKALGIVLALTMAFAITACGAKEDSVGKHCAPSIGNNGRGAVLFYSDRREVG